MEPFSVLAVPRLECGEMDIYATTQCILDLHVSLIYSFWKARRTSAGKELTFLLSASAVLLYAILIFNCFKNNIRG